MSHTEGHITVVVSWSKGIDKAKRDNILEGNKREIISPPLELGVRAKDQAKLQVTDGVLQKVSPWLVLRFIIY